tara:strand:- start:8332 stop:9168 length:837 start_codon:yes stop_codon:yes gene_type:complete
MKNQIKTLENYSLIDLCKTGGLQDIYDISVNSANEVCNLSTTGGRKRQKSLAAQVAKSKVLFEKACRGFVQDKKAEIKSVVEPAEKEIRSFVKSMDELRDKTKEPVLAIERLESDELEAYEIAAQMVLDAEKAAREALHAAQAKIFAHMEAKEQHGEYKELKTPMEFAKFHFENKENQAGNFDSEKWLIEEEIEETEEERRAVELAVIDKHKAARFIMPSAKDLPAVAVDNPSIDFAELGAVEDLLKAVPELQNNKNIASEIISAIKNGKIGGVEWDK